MIQEPANFVWRSLWIHHTPRNRDHLYSNHQSRTCCCSPLPSLPWSKLPSVCQIRFGIRSSVSLIFLAPPTTTTSHSLLSESQVFPFSKGAFSYTTALLPWLFRLTDGQTDSQSDSQKQWISVLHRLIFLVPPATRALVNGKRNETFQWWELFFLPKLLFVSILSWNDKNIRQIEMAPKEMLVGWGDGGKCKNNILGLYKKWRGSMCVSSTLKWCPKKLLLFSNFNNLKVGFDSIPLTDVLSDSFTVMDQWCQVQYHNRFDWPVKLIPFLSLKHIDLTWHEVM